MARGAASGVMGAIGAGGCAALAPMYCCIAAVAASAAEGVSLTVLVSAETCPIRVASISSRVGGGLVPLPLGVPLGLVIDKEGGVGTGSV